MLARTTPPLPRPARLDPGQSWFAAFTTPSGQRKALEAIEDLDLPVFAPMERVARTLRGRRIEIERFLFPRYVFVGFATEAEWSAILECDGVAGILGQDQPRAINPDEIEKLRRAEIAGVFDYCTAKAAFAAGDSVRIGEGVWGGIVARVLKASPRKRVKVLLDGLGTLDIDACNLEKVA